MDVVGESTSVEQFCIYMEYGDDFHECLKNAIESKDIKSGAVLSGIGTFSEARIHYIQNTEFPPEDKFVEIKGPIELCSVDGIIADYEPHLHCTMSIRGDELWAGHLEPGCRVLYLAEVAVVKFSDLTLKRDNDPEFGTPRLIKQKK